MTSRRGRCRFSPDIFASESRPLPINSLFLTPGRFSAFRLIMSGTTRVYITLLFQFTRCYEYIKHYMEIHISCESWLMYKQGQTFSYQLDLCLFTMLCIDYVYHSTDSHLLTMIYEQLVSEIFRTMAFDQYL